MTPFWNEKKILITGGSGFIGSHLTNSLLSKGANVSIIDWNMPLGFPIINCMNSYQPDFYKKNILDLDWVSFLTEKKFDIIFHLAGNANVNLSVENPYNDFESNVITSIRLLEALRTISWQGRIIFPSSAAVYGNPIKLPIHEDDPTMPISPYGAAKLAVERYVMIYSKLYSLKSAIVRPFSIYGPGQKKLVVYDILTKLKKNPNEILLFGTGEQIRDFLYIEDMINGLLLVAEKGNLCGETYNLASGNGFSILQLVNLVCGILKISPKINFSGSVRVGEPDKWTVDIMRLKKLGFDASVNMQEGIKRTIEWFYEIRTAD